MSQRGGVRQRGNTWQARWTSDGQNRSKSGFPTRKDALNYLATVRSEIARGDHIDPRQGYITVEQWSRQWLASRTDLAPSTKNRYWSALTTHIWPAWGYRRIADIRPSDVRELLADSLAAGSAPATAAKTLQVVKLLFAAAVDDRLVRANPAANVRNPKIPRRPTLFLTPEEVSRLVDAMPSVRDKAMTAVLAWCGLRFGELTGLDLSSYDPLRGRVAVYATKTDKYRRVPVPPQARTLLDAWVEQRGPDAGPLFVNAAGARVDSSGWRARVWVPAKQRARLDRRLRVHDLRHTCASLLIHSGASVKLVADWLGHSSPVITLTTYSHLLPSELEDLSDRLAGLAAREGTGPATIADVTRLGDVGG